MQSAIGRIQLKKLDGWNFSRSKNALIFLDLLKDLPVFRIPFPPSTLKSAWYKLYGYLNKNALAADWDRRRILNELQNSGYPALTGSCSEVYLEKCFQNSGISPAYRLPNAQLLGETSLMFLVHPGMSERQVFNYAKSVKHILLKSTR